MGSPDARTGSGLKINKKTTSIPQPIRHPGEDIRDAKAIFEQRFGMQTWNDVNLWLQFAREVKEYMGLSSIEETAKYLGIKNNRRNYQP